ncbi:Glycine--tRNA ligase 1, mitochondrial [Myotisia sp. PD_48]|nr:Glycine--tRNA ligase 1, mitochondrial [Myotisia sp. PD_48]
MAPSIPSAKLTLSCPLFAADFDPKQNGLLLVGGGGGESRSGVGNSIFLIDTSRREQISELLDISLSRDEDSVTSLGVAQSNDDDIVAFAGINSSQAEQQQDRNQHLRSFKVDIPQRKKPQNDSNNEVVGKENRRPSEKAQDGLKTKALSQVSLFKPQPGKAGQERETYQRILRLSPYDPEDPVRIGAIATGLAPRGEVVIFKASSPTVSSSDVLGRISLGNKVEAEDIDITKTENEGQFKVAYTDGQSVYFTTLSKSTSRSNLKAEAFYTVNDAASLNNPESKIRAVRFLSPYSLVLLQNLPGRAGCEVVVIYIPTKDSHYIVTRRRRLHKSMKIGLGLDVCRLSESSKGEVQYIISAFGNDLSIEILALDFSPQKGFKNFWHYATLNKVHPFSMTRIVLSTFIPPPLPVTADIRPQYVKLASVSVGNTVIVHTLPLTPHPGSSKEPRYVLISPGVSELTGTVFSTVVAIVIVAFAAFFLQAFTEIRGGVPPTLGAVNWLSPRLRNMLAKPYIFDGGHPNDPATSQAASSPLSNVPQYAAPTKRLPELINSLSQAQDSADSAQNLQAILVQDLGVDISATPTNIPHDEEKHDAERVPATKWEDMSEEQQEAWRQKLMDVGHWALEQNEAMLRGVLFGQLAGNAV